MNVDKDNNIFNRNNKIDWEQKVININNNLLKIVTYYLIWI